jgi:hypothetical protein
MDRFAMDKLHITPKTDFELHRALSNFELKWEQKARRALKDDRISRF